MNFKSNLFILVSIFSCSVIYAALPPYAAAERKKALMESVKEQRQNSQNVITMKVTKVTMEALVLDRCPSIEHWSIQAIVEDVEKGDLQPGDHLNIVYSEKVYECPGPQRYYTKKLEKDTITSAYLNCVKNECTISSGPWSFHTETEFLSEYLETTAEDEYWKLNR